MDEQAVTGTDTIRKTSITENWYFNRLPKDTTLEEPKISLSYDEKEDIWAIESDNGFHLMPGEKKEVTLFDLYHAMC